MSRAQLLKSLIKGTDIAEDATLNKYLMSRGINPKYATKDQKVAHSKTGAFITWKNSRMLEDTLEERVDKKDTVTLDIPLLIRIMELAREDIKTDMDLHRVVEKLINIRNKGMLTMKDYNYIAKIHEEVMPQIPVEQIDEISKELTHSYFKKAYAQKYNNEPAKPTKLQMKNRNKGMNRAHKRLVNRLELPKGTDPSEGGKYTADSVEHDNTTMVEAQSAAVRWQKALEAAKKKREEEAARNAENAKRALTPVKEDKFQDPMAATQTVGMEVDNPSDAERKSQRSKSARIIKSIYKRKNMKEDLYDHEKDDKPAATYGKKPKMSVTKPTDNVGENKPDAAAILTGGKTLTGQTRDTIEIDPMMKKRPGSDPTGKNK